MKAGELAALTIAREVATDPPETNDRARLLRVSLYTALDAVDALTAERARLRDDRDELRATLDNERGEGVPPSEGWAWDDSCWVRDLPDNRQLRVSLEADTDTPNWRCWEEEAADYSGSFIANAPTARAAMIAADLATKEKS